MAATVDTENFCKPDGPRYEGSYAGGSARFSGELNVVSWNIKFAREIDTAIAELNETDQLRNADIMLLQEMDDEGVDAIARSLGLNYVYFPASVHCRTGKKFGNAVLARWEISGSAKLLLPHE
ncbi:MAG TPA: endonuclease/exonuclease/phosphatase family protein, partial [Actinobacteria bacterium]|nr:endonuclease/exonuclease/phosphatase family protein [Actinomycetota bacterium]